MANNPLVGAWELVSDSSAGVLIYTGSHYATVSAPKNRRRSAGDQATPGEALDALLTSPALSGTYTVSGSTITHARLANTRAERSDQPLVADHTIDGGTMTFNVMSGASSTNAGASLTWRRIPSGGAGGPLVGAWEMVDDARQGILIYTETHYAGVFRQKERNLPKGDQYTPEEALEAISAVGAATGTYTIAGNILTAERIANLRPTDVGVTIVQEFTVEGDTLSLRGVSGIRPGEMNWRRVS